MPMINYQDLANADISESLSHRNVHDHLKSLSTDELKTMCDSDRVNFGVCILNVTGELNVGTIIRNSLLTGAERLAVMGRRKYDKRGTVGSENYLTVERIDALSDEMNIDKDIFWNWIDQNSYTPIFVEQGGVMVTKVDWNSWTIPNKKFCFVFGNENRGIQDDILHDARGRIVSIPQRGVIRSYNVGCASAIVLYDAASKMGWI